MILDKLIEYTVYKCLNKYIFTCKQYSIISTAHSPALHILKKPNWSDISRISRYFYNITWVVDIVGTT